MPEEVATPELDKMLKVKDESQSIGEFLDHLLLKGICLCQYHPSKYEYTTPEFEEQIKNSSDEEARLLRMNNPEKYNFIPAGHYQLQTPIEKLLAEYFGIDLKKCEEERQLILKQIRNKKQ